MTVASYITTLVYSTTSHAATTWKKNVCVRMEKVSIVTTEMVYSPMLRSPLARGVPSLGREGRGIVVPPLQTSSLPKIKRERVVRVGAFVLVIVKK
jgi:hypothetical protein